MNHGLSERTALRIRRILAVFAEVDEAILYGSRAMGNFKPGSDVDLALRGQALTWQVCAEMAGMFEASSVPYKVDLTPLALLEHEGLRAHIDRVGVVFFNRDRWDAEQAVVRRAAGAGRSP